MTEPALPTRVTVNWIAHCAGIHYNTAKRRLEGMERDEHGLLDRVRALGRVFVGEGGEGSQKSDQFGKMIMLKKKAHGPSQTMLLP